MTIKVTVWDGNRFAGIFLLPNATPIANIADAVESLGITYTEIHTETIDEQDQLIWSRFMSAAGV